MEAVGTQPWRRGVCGRMARLVALGLCVVLGGGAHAWAAPPKRGASVEKLASEAAAAYRGGDYERAIERLQRAYEIEPAPTLIYNQARAYDRWGHTEQALERYQEFLALPDGEAKLRGQAETRERALTASLRAAALKRAPADAAHAVAPAPVAPAAAPPAPEPAPSIPPDVAGANPKAGAFLFHLGKAYERLKQPQKAIAHYTRFLASPDGDPKLRAEAEVRLRALGASPPGPGTATPAPTREGGGGRPPAPGAAPG